jgi:succinoglycan biosynthesis transport protein ExoP
MAERGERSMLRDYLRVLRRRKWMFLQAVLIIPIAVVFLSLRQTPQYQASAEVLLKNEDLAASLTGTSLQVYQDPIRLVQTQADLARVPEVAQQVLRAAHVPGMTPDSFLAASSVTARQDADLLVFSVNDRHPSVAERLATEYARQYTIYRYRLDTAAIASALKEVRSRIQELPPGDRASLIEKEQQLRTIAALKTSNAALVRAADGAAKVRPRPVRSGILGLGVGLVLGLVLAFLKETFDPRVRTADEVAEELDLPLLARLPEPNRTLRKQNDLVMVVKPTSPEAEPFRILRSNVEFVNLERRVRTIMVTSAVEQEGKSTTAANLAVAFARAGMKVTLVDLDLRRPFLHRFFDIEISPGVTDVALGRVNLEEALVRVKPAGAEAVDAPSPNGDRPDPMRFDVLTAGSRPPDPGEFVASKALSMILSQVAATSDLVLIDAPPLLHLGDAVALSAKVDALLLVVRLKVAKRPMLRELHRVVDNCAATPLGFVLAGAEAEEGYEYAGYYYYSRATTTREAEPVRKP